MAEMTLRMKKELAKEMYLKSQMTQKDIAKMVGVTEKTMSNWINDEDEKWAMLKSSFIITKEEELGRIFRQIHEINTCIENKEPGQRYASSKEADTLSKLSATAKNMESDAGISEIISVFIEFSEFLKAINLDKAKDFIGLQDAFIKHKMAKL